ncbi:histidine ammonia-lyase [Rhizobium sp. CG5]|uniref:HAL/PAL/TAL family ammonia-lyase n=1 Tax=Rhizobium sp. CG5 TaxID=2726076 RepID=UPI0020337AFD|nr:histidine ammonia-lyase [Rhizobium sp. CG5]MCM2474163.1 histidine ammonia-lyase [Rhizobium sp. CG5]
MATIRLDAPLSWPDVAAIATGKASLELSANAWSRIEAAHAIVQSIVDRNMRGYGITTGVGALSDVAVTREQQAALSRNILMSHAVGVGAPLSIVESRAIMVAAINNFAHGYSGLRPVIIRYLLALLDVGFTPEVPRQGSVGYLSHIAHVHLVLIGHGFIRIGGERLPARDALARLGLEPLALEAKEGLCLVNGTPCVSGLASLALIQTRQLLDWADAIAAMTFETQRCQLRAIAPEAMAVRTAPGLLRVAERMNSLLQGSDILVESAGRRVQDALSLRSIPHVHGAVHDGVESVSLVVDRELSSVTDNPIVMGTPEAPEVYSQAHAVGASMGLAMDQLAVAMAELGAMSERRIDRMVNPLVSGLPAFLAEDSGVASGFMIAQYTAVSLVGENRRLAAPASLDGGITSGLQEDMLCHATPAALKALDILANLRRILAIELLAACQSYDIGGLKDQAAPRTRALFDALRQRIVIYADDRPLGEDIEAAADFLGATTVDDIMVAAGF